MIVAERRKLNRSQILYYLRVFDRETDQLIGYVEDISPGGIMLRGKSSIERGKTYRLRFIMPSIIMKEEKAIECEAKCVWTKLDFDEDVFFSGFSFSFLDVHYLEIIKYLINKYGFKYY